VTLYCATSNPGKLREFWLAGERFGIRVLELPGLKEIATCEETGITFKENAVLKATYYGQHAPGLLFADDSGLEVDALNGAPGVHSARYAADQPHLAAENTDDEANNARVLRELAPHVEPPVRAWLAAACESIG
jgi:XTP/dITP diphosphohydrolase